MLLTSMFSYCLSFPFNFLGFNELARLLAGGDMVRR